MPAPKRQILASSFNGWTKQQAMSMQQTAAAAIRLQLQPIIVMMLGVAVAASEVKTQTAGLAVIIASRMPTATYRW